MLLPFAASAQAERKREIVANDDVRLEVIAEGAGPPVVLLPSRRARPGSRRRVNPASDRF
jgi:hypothetical protein